MGNNNRSFNCVFFTQILFNHLDIITGWAFEAHPVQEFGNGLIKVHFLILIGEVTNQMKEKTHVSL